MPKLPGLIKGLGVTMGTMEDLIAMDLPSPPVLYTLGTIEVREIFKNHDSFAIGIAELMFHFAVRVKRVGVDDDHPGFHGAKKSDGVLQNIWHLKCDAIAFFKFAHIEQVRREVIRILIDLVKAQSVIHVGKRRLVAKTFHGLIKNIEDRIVFAEIDRRIDALWIAFEPNFFHTRSFFCD